MMRYLVRGLFSLVLLAVLFLVSLWFYPETFLNPATIRWTLDRFGMRESVRWDSLILEFRRAEPFSKQIFIKGTGILYTDAAGNALDLKSLELEAKIDLRLHGIYISALPLIAIDARQLIITKSPNSATANISKYSLDLRIPKPMVLFPAAFRENIFGRISINVDEFYFAGIRGRATFRSNEGESPTTKHFQGDGKLKIDGVEIATDFLLYADSRNHSFQLEGNVDSRFKNQRVWGRLVGTWSDALHVKLAAKWQERKKLVRPLDIDLWQEGTKLRIAARTEKPAIPGLPLEITRIACELSGELSSDLGEPRDLNIHCPFEYKLPKKTGFYLANQNAWGGELLLQSSLVRRENRLTFADARLLFSTKTKEFTVETDLRGSVDADLQSFALTDFRLDQLDGNLNLREFGWAVSNFEGSAWAIPAPFRTLRGPVRGVLKGEQGSTGFGIGANLNFDLSDKRQSFRASIAAKTDFPFQSLKEIGPEFKNSGVRVAMSVDLNDVALELPRLEASSLPSIFPDKRFLRNSAQRKNIGEEIQLDFSLSSGKPIRLFSNLLKDPISLQLDYRFPAGKKANGKLNFEPMDVTFFRRQVHVERMALRTNGGSGITEIDGVLTYATSEVLIRIFLNGPFDSPRVEFESDPPLSRDQIVSVLVFNSSLDELSEENQKSATSLGQALGSGAFSLGAMYLLASTPIESVHFDPVTRNYSARVRIDRTTTVRLGSDAPETQNYGIGKRFGRRFSLQTELERSPEKANTVSTVIKWFMRY